MDQWKGVLRRYQQELRTGLIVDNFLPALRPLLTDVEYSRVVDRTGNIEKVDALIAILLTKDYKLFDELCRALEENGYSCWVEKLTKSMDAYQVDNYQDPFLQCQIEFPVLDDLADEFALLIADVRATVHALSPGRLEGLKGAIGEKLKSKGARSIPLPSSPAELMDRIHQYWDFLNFELARVVLKYLGVDDLQQRMQTYEEHLKQGAQKILTECRSRQLNPAPPGEYIIMSMTLDEDPFSYSLHRILEIKGFLKRIGLDEALFAGWNKHCIILHFYILDSNVDAAALYLKEHQEELQKMHVLNVDAKGFRIFQLQMPNDEASVRNTVLVSSSTCDTPAVKIPANVMARTMPQSSLSLQTVASAQWEFKPREYTLVVTGCSGRGKSTFCNFLSKSDMFKPEPPGSEMSSGEFGAWGAIAADLTGTQFGTVKDLVGGVTLRIIDLPGYLATHNRTGNDREDLAKDGKMVLDEFAKALMHAKDGIDAIFIALKAAERYSREEELLMEFISVLQLWDHCILLFTHGDKAGKEENQRYQDFHKLIKSPSFPERSPVLYKMLQFVNNRFVIVESVNKEEDQEYYLSKVDELCEAIESVRRKTGTAIGHPLLKLARNAFEVVQVQQYLREVLDQEREDKDKIQKDLEQSRREQEEKDETYKSLEADLERERADLEREKADLERERTERKREKTDLEKERTEWKKEKADLERERAEREREKADLERERAEREREKADLERERAEREVEKAVLEREKSELERKKADLEREQAEKTNSSQLMKLRNDLEDGLQQKKLQPKGKVEHDAAVGVLVSWLEEPQVGPDTVADRYANLSALADDRERMMKELNALSQQLHKGIGFASKKRISQKISAILTAHAYNVETSTNSSFIIVSKSSQSTDDSIQEGHVSEQQAQKNYCTLL